MDKQVDRIWKRFNTAKKISMSPGRYITTDHGRDSATGKHHGGQSDRERATWIVTNATDLMNRRGNSQVL